MAFVLTPGYRHEQTAFMELLRRGAVKRLGRGRPKLRPRANLNPIEPAWAKVKTELRRVGARTVDALHEALGPALGAISPQHAAGFFRHSGYSCPN